MLDSKPYAVFFKYIIPSILGLLAISSASIVDGYFIGNYVGATALAAINISYPITTVLFGFAAMFAVGSSVVVGKLMGEKNTLEAHNIFSKAMYAIAFISIILCTILYINIESILSLLEVKEELKFFTLDYLPILLIFLPFLMTAIVLDYFVRVDENPNLSFLALLLSSLINIILDYVFIVVYDFGITGAAYATGISQAMIMLFLIPHFFSKKVTLKFIKPIGSWINLFKALKNGASEFINESSAGITVLIFNYILLQHFGSSGVASFTIVGYFLMISTMISFAIADGVQPLISKNFGALKYDRIASFLKLAFFTIISIELIIVSVAVFIPEILVGIFLKENETQTLQITLEFISYAWPAFLFLGLNILITSYLTAMQKPTYSVIIAILRSLILPILLINTLPIFFESKGIFLALSVSEVLSFIIAFMFFTRVKSQNINNEIFSKI